MIASLKGRVQTKDEKGAVIDVGGVGYSVAMSLTGLASLGAVGEPCQLVVHTHLSQDALRLFGFADPAERTAFETLIGTSGVGPRLALAILSTLSPEELQQVVINGDKAMLNRIPGVGPKKAERLLLELKDRLKVEVSSIGVPGRQGLMDDLVSALSNLGFKSETATAAAKKGLEAHPDEEDLAVLVRTALRATTKA